MLKFKIKIIEYNHKNLLTQAFAKDYELIKFSIMLIYLTLKLTVWL